MKAGHLPQQQAQQTHLHIHHHQQQQQKLAAELANRRNLTNQQIIENELAKIQQEKLRIQRQQETLAQKVNIVTTNRHDSRSFTSTQHVTLSSLALWING